ncbi:MAG: hypothetical protein V2J02_20645 [Pseudomonadales bacterium]|nr:hypothetical protein [Pseudomonadales bacterium]
MNARPRSAVPPLQRLAGLAALLLAALCFRPDAPPGLVQDGILPALAVLGAGLVLRSVLAVAGTVLLLAGAHADLGADDLLASRVHPLLAVLAAAVVAVELGRRLRARAQATRAARAEARDRRQRERSGNG